MQPCRKHTTQSAHRDGAHSRHHPGADPGAESIVPLFSWGWGLSLLLRIEIVRILNFANRHCHVRKRDSRRSRELEVGELNFEVEFYKSLNRPESQCHPWHTDGSLSAAHPLLFIALPHFPDWISMLSHPAGEKWPVLCPALSQPAHCSESPPRASANHRTKGC